MVFLDSPMASDATEVFVRYHDWLDEHAQTMFAAGRHPFDFPGLEYVRTVARSKGINRIHGSCIIMAGSGMCTGGRVKHHLAANITRPQSTILFLGYQAVDTLGRQIVDGHPQVRILGQIYPVRARVERLYGFSAHADRHGLLQWLDHLRVAPRRVFLTHGEENAALSLAEAIRKNKGWDVAVPQYRESVPLS
jgi:metallo-beta-lactamase family protein